jgi:hypothetical protein
MTILLPSTILLSQSTAREGQGVSHVSANRTCGRQAPGDYARHKTIITKRALVCTIQLTWQSHKRVRRRGCSAITPQLACFSKRASDAKSQTSGRVLGVQYCTSGNNTNIGNHHQAVHLAQTVRSIVNTLSVQEFRVCTATRPGRRQLQAKQRLSVQDSVHINAHTTVAITTKSSHHQPSHHNNQALTQKPAPCLMLLPAALRLCW